MNGPKPRVLIVGATSAIAEGVALRYAHRGATMVLIARHAERLDTVAGNLDARGATIGATLQADLADVDRHTSLVDQAMAILGGIDVAIVAHGMLPDQPALDTDVEASLSAFHLNGASAISITHRIALAMASHGGGTVAVLSSVAGDRGRTSLYAYGAAKAALTAYTAGLRGRFAGRGVHVVTVKPGVIATPMTSGRFPAFLASTVEVAARRIVRAIDRRTPIVYVPGWWRLVMAIVKLVPERLFMRLPL